MILPSADFVRRCVITLAVYLFSFCQTHAGAEPAPVLKMAGGNLSQDGHAKLQWEAAGAGEEVEVQQAGDENFVSARTIYRGPDNATFISGLEDGSYYYRARHIGGAWSHAVVLTVKHHSLTSALIFFTLGAIVFALTVFVVVKGALQASVD